MATICALFALGSCSFDTDRSAPHVQSAIAPGACGTTETLLPKLSVFLEEDRFEPLRQVIVERFDDPALRTLLGAIVTMVSRLGLDRTELVIEIAKKGEIEENLAPLLVAALGLVDGRTDGTTRYEVPDAAALFIDRCDPDHLLTGVEGILRLTSPSHGKPWLTATLEEASPLISDPALVPFLQSFEQNAERGKPAIIAIGVQIMVFLADDNFSIDRVETLLESAVYPLVSPALKAKIEVLVAMLDEATRPEAGILAPIQGAVRCGLMHPEARDQLLGFVFDLIASEKVGLDTIIESTIAITRETGAKNELDLVADVVAIVRDDPSLSRDIRGLLSTVLSQPDVELTLPVFIELLDREVLGEALEAVAKLLSGCGRFDPES